MKLKWMIVITLVIMLFAAPSSAEQASAQKLFEQGVEQFDNGDFVRSRQLLLEALARAEATNEAAVHGKLRAKISLYLGLNQAMEREPAAARDRFREALRIDAGLRLDPERFKPELVAVFERVRRSLQGRLAITASRADVEVLIDGESAGNPPVQRMLAEGTVVVEAQDRAGRRLARRSVVVRAGATARLFLSLPVTAKKKAAAPSPSPRPTVREQAGPERPRKRVWTWVAGAGAAVFTAVAIGTALSAASDRDAGCALLGDPALDCEARSWLLDPNQRARYESLHDSASSKTFAANLSIIAASVLAATAVVLYLLEDRPRPARAEIGWGWGWGSGQLRLRY